MVDYLKKNITIKESWLLHNQVMINNLMRSIIRSNIKIPAAFGGMLTRINL